MVERSRRAKGDALFLFFWAWVIMGLVWSAWKLELAVGGAYARLLDLEVLMGCVLALRLGCFRSGVPRGT